VQELAVTNHQRVPDLKHEACSAMYGGVRFTTRGKLHVFSCKKMHEKAIPVILKEP